MLLALVLLVEPSLYGPHRYFAHHTLQMERYPKFHNEVGASIVRIGCREFKCIGDEPPQDQPVCTDNSIRRRRSKRTA